MIKYVLHINYMKHEIKYIPIGQLPQSLSFIPQPPRGLYVQGELAT